MPSYYAFEGNAILGRERLGTEGKHIWHDLKTDNGAKHRAYRLFNGKAFRLYRFTNMYDQSTFVEIATQGRFK